MARFSQKAAIKMKQLSRNAPKHDAPVCGVTVMGSVHCSEGFGRKSTLHDLAALECHVFYVACMLIIHLGARETRSSVLVGLSYHILPSLFELPCPLPASKERLITAFAAPSFVSSAGYSLRLNLTPIVKAHFCVNYYSSQILPLFFCVIKKLLQ